MKHDNPVYDQTEETLSISPITSGQDDDESNEKTGLLKGDRNESVNESVITDTNSWYNLLLLVYFFSFSTLWLPLCLQYLIMSMPMLYLVQYVKGRSYIVLKLFFIMDDI